MLLHGASDLDQICLKVHNSEDGCTFPPNIFAPTSKITTKPNFWVPFYAKPIIQRAVCYKAETLQLYRYRQVLGCVKIFPLGAFGGAGPQ